MELGDGAATLEQMPGMGKQPKVWRQHAALLARLKTDMLIWFPPGATLGSRTA